MCLCLKIKGGWIGTKKDCESRKKEFYAASNRFWGLYKELIFADRAIGRFLFLMDEFQLKAEEAILKLNKDLAFIKRLE